MEPAFVLSSLEELRDFDQSPLRPHPRAEDRLVAGVDVADIELCGKLSGRAAGDEPAPLRKHGDTLFKHLAADMLEDNIDALLVRHPPDLLGEIDVAIVDQFVRSELFPSPQFFVRSGRGDNPRSEEHTSDTGLVLAGGGRTDGDVDGRR